MLKAILFDADGVLVDACEIHYKALNKSLIQHNYKEISKEDHLNTFNGLPTKKKLAILVERNLVNTSDCRVIEITKQKITNELFKQDLKLDAQKINLLIALVDLNLKIAVVSNSIKDSLITMMKSIGIYHLLDLTLGNDQGFRPKPHPDMYIEASNRLNINISECIIVEDSPIGIKAAVDAKPLKVIEVKNPYDEKLIPSNFINLIREYL